MAEIRNPRVSIALPAELMRSLERWAEAKGDKPASLAAFLLRTAIEDADKSGEIPGEGKDERLLRQLSDRTGLAPDDILKAIQIFKDSHICGGG